MDMPISSRKDFGKFLSEYCPRGIGVEVGVKTGQFAKHILADWPDGCMVLVDSWKPLPDYDDPANVSQEEHNHNLLRTRRGLPNRAAIIVAPSLVAASILKGPFDFVYLDANHTAEHVKQDILAWLPKIKPYGYICGHDYFNGEFGEHGPIYNDSKQCGVKFAVERVFEKRRIQVTTDDPYPSWFVKI